MSKSSQGKISIAVIALAGILSLTLHLSLTEKSALADGGDCTDADAGSVTGTGDLVSFTTPASETVTGVCIKSGNNTFGSDDHSGQFTSDGTYGNNNCYVVSGISSTTVTVSRVNSDACKDISHIDVYYSTPTPTPTPTPTVTPTPTPTVTPTPTPTATPTPTPTATPDPNGQGGNGTPTPTPTPTTTPTPTPTNIPGGQGGSGDDNEPDCCPGQDDPTPTPKISAVGGGKVAAATVTPTVAPSTNLKKFPSSGFNPLHIFSLFRLPW